MAGRCLRLRREGAMAEAGSGERRKWQRSILQVPVEAVRTRYRQDEASRVINLHLRDVSRGGVGGLSPVRLDPAEAITVFFPPLGSSPGRDLATRVVRCEQSHDLYHIGLAFHESLDEGRRVPDV